MKVIGIPSDFIGNHYEEILAYTMCLFHLKHLDLNDQYSQDYFEVMSFMESPNTTLRLTL